jgi:nucleotide-binding universal stress UspA family protein
MHGPLVVGVDGSDASLFGLREAASMAQGTRSALIAVFVRPPAYKMWTAFTFCGVCSIGAVDDVTETVIEAECIAILGSAQLNWQFEIRSGEPAAALMAVAKEYRAETIVVSGRRHCAVGSIAHGAIMTRLLHRWAGALVLLHPPPESKADFSRNAEAQR